MTQHVGGDVLAGQRGAGAPDRLNQPGQAVEPVGGNADSVPDLLNEQGVERADTKEPPGSGFPVGIPAKDEQDKRDNRNDSAPGKTVPVKKSPNHPTSGKPPQLRMVLDSSGSKAAKAGR